MNSLSALCIITFDKSQSNYDDTMIECYGTISGNTKTSSHRSRPMAILVSLRFSKGLNARRM